MFSPCGENAPDGLHVEMVSPCGDGVGPDGDFMPVSGVQSPGGDRFRASFSGQDRVRFEGGRGSARRTLSPMGLFADLVLDLFPETSPSFKSQDAIRLARLRSKGAARKVASITSSAASENIESG